MTDSVSPVSASFITLLHSRIFAVATLLNLVQTSLAITLREQEIIDCWLRSRLFVTYVTTAIGGDNFIHI